MVKVFLTRFNVHTSGAGGSRTRTRHTINIAVVETCFKSGVNVDSSRKSHRDSTKKRCSAGGRSNSGGGDGLLLAYGGGETVLTELIVTLVSGHGTGELSGCEGVRQVGGVDVVGTAVFGAGVTVGGIAVGGGSRAGIVVGARWTLEVAGRLVRRVLGGGGG